MKILIAGAWPYANGSLHIGRLAALLPGDVLARYHRLKGDEVIAKNDPLVVAVKNEVDALYAAGRNTVMGDEELEIIVRNCDKYRYERLLFHKST